MTNHDPIRVILIDDHTKIHFAIGKLLNEVDNIDLIAQGSSGQEAIDLCQQYQPDVILMDVIMPDLSGIEATQAILKRFPTIKILALSGFMDKDSIQAMLEAGAVGYVLKTSNTDELANTIRTAYGGNTVFSTQVMQTLLSQPTVNPRKTYGFTRREVDVLSYMVEGLTNSEIAELMTVSVSTVKFHVSNILQKLTVRSRTEAVTRAMEENLV